MPNTVDKIRIQQALVDLVRAGPYYAVTYDAGTNRPADIDAGVDTPVTPISVGANEIAGDFGLDENMGRRFLRDRVSWVWSAICKFNQEVTSYAAEAAWTDTPPTLASDETNGLRQAKLELVRAVPQHPTRQQSSSGSIIEFTFEIRLSRR